MFSTDTSKNTVSKTKLIFENGHNMRFKILVLFFHGLVAAQTYSSMIDRMMAQLRDRRTKMLMSKSSTVPRSHFKLVEFNHEGNEELCDAIEKRSPNKEFRKIFWDMNPDSMSKVMRHELCHFWTKMVTGLILRILAKTFLDFLFLRCRLKNRYRKPLPVPTMNDWDFSNRKREKILHFRLLGAIINYESWGPLYKGIWKDSSEGPFRFTHTFNAYW